MHVIEKDVIFTFTLKDHSKAWPNALSLTVTNPIDKSVRTSSVSASKLLDSPIIKSSTTNITITKYSKPTATEDGILTVIAGPNDPGLWKFRIIEVVDASTCNHKIYHEWMTNFIKHESTSKGTFSVPDFTY